MNLQKLAVLGLVCFSLASCAQSGSPPGSTGPGASGGVSGGGTGGTKGGDSPPAGQPLNGGATGQNVGSGGTTAGAGGTTAGTGGANTPATDAAPGPTPTGTPDAGPAAPDPQPTGQMRKVATVAEFDQAAAASKPGDAIVFANGTYSDFKLTFKANGTEEKPIFLQAETPGQVVFHGASQLFIEGDWLVVSGLKYEGIANVPNITTGDDVVVGSVVTFRKTTNHARLTETAIVDSGTKVSSYFHMEPGGQFNRVDHCWFSGQKDIGPSLYIEIDKEKPNNAVMEACFVGNRRQGTGNRWETLRIGHSEQQYFKSNALVTRNYFTKCDGENEMISNKSTGNKYLYNTIVDNNGELTLRHGDDTWIEGNFLESSSGIRVIGKRHVIISNYLKKMNFGFNIYAAEANPEAKGYASVVDPIIAFNTLEDCGTAFLLGTSGRPVAPKNVRVAYNLVQATGGVLEYANAGSDIKYEGNIMYGGNLAERAGINREKPALLADQWGRLVADASKLPFPVDATAFPQAKNDLNGTPRGDKPNVGAIQTANTKPRYPLSPKDVGPKWMGRVDDGAVALPKLSAVADPLRGTVEILLPDFHARAVTIEIRDGAGRLVRRLVADRDRITWDRSDAAGKHAPAGRYTVLIAGQDPRLGRVVVVP